MVCDFGECVTYTYMKFEGIRCIWPLFFWLHCDVQGRFLTPLSSLLIIVGYYLVYLAEEKSYSVLHFPVKFFAIFFSYQ